MSDDQNQERDESAEGVLLWLEAEAARIMAKTNNEAIKKHIARGLERFRKISSDGGPVELLQKLAENKASGWERLLDPPKPPTGIDRLPIPGRPLGDQWRDLCLWLTVQAHQLIRATDDIELKDRILEQYDALIRESRLPLTLDALRLRVGTFKTTVEDWCASRIRTVVPGAAAWPERKK